MITHTVHAAHRLVITTFTGTVDGAAVIASYRDLYARAGWHPGMNELIDIRGADVTQVSSSTMGHLAQVVKGAHGNVAEPPLTAALVSNDYQYGMSRMYEGLAADGPERVQHFRDVVAALRWLGVPEDLYR